MDKRQNNKMRNSHYKSTDNFVNFFRVKIEKKTGNFNAANEQI